MIIKEVLRLKKLGLSQRKIAIQLGVSRSAVQKYWKGDVPVSAAAPPNWVEQIDWSYIEQEVNNKVPKLILYDELKENIALPSYSSFCKFLRKKIVFKPEISVKIDRVPGDSVEVDYGGSSVDILNPATGEIIKTELFVGCMTYSKLIFAEFTFSQKLADFIESHNRMFTYYGGVPNYIVIDNLKSGVTKPDKLDPIINKTYHDQCIHYGLIVDPADARKPKHKPNAEKAVDIVQRGFIKKFRNRTFTSLGELNRELRNFLLQVNSKVMTGKNVSRLELFEKERKLLKKLPTNKYQMAYWKLAKVHPDCHIQHQYNYYSVPSEYVGKQVEVKYNSTLIEIYYQGKSLTVHKIFKGRGIYSTKKGHYPERKVAELQISYQRLNYQANLIGPNTGRLIKRIFEEHKFPLKKIRKVQAILALKGKYGSDALEHASGFALEFDSLSHRYIKSCAKNYQVQSKKKKTGAPKRDGEFICLQGGKANE